MYILSDEIFLFLTILMIHCERLFRASVESVVFLSWTSLQLGLIARLNVIVRLGCAVRSSDQSAVALGYKRSIELLRKTGLPLKWFAHETEHLRML
jgi:hypothetical protein